MRSDPVGGRPRSRVVVEVLAGLLLAAEPLALLGAALDSRTHHRALGGVTFACGALLLIGGGFAVARRTLGGSPIARGVLWAVGGASFGAVLLAAGSALVGAR